MKRIQPPASIVFAAMLATLVPAFAGPEGGSVVGGNATISGQGSAAVTIQQNSDRAIINWNTFNIGAGEIARFNQPSTSAVALNRVTGGQGPSQIFGTISANGRVFLINRDGILFGPGAVVDTSGFLATTHDIRNDDFMAGRYVFGIPGRDDASIVNQGTITAHNAGFAALVAPGVRNSGTITANLGVVSLASGNGFTLDFYGDRLITLGVSDSVAANIRDVATGQPLTSLVRNDGRLRANGGRVELSAVTARRVVDSVINNTGVIEANTFRRRGGTIVLSAGTGQAGPAGVKAPRYKQTVRVSGTLSASARKKGKGGTVVVTGENIEVAGARIDVSGPAGGGTVMIGGDWSGGHPDTGLVTNSSARLAAYAVPTAATVTVDGATVIDASATRAGNGGKVIVWADGTNTFAGTILARGGVMSGDGGFVETSGHQTLNYSGHVDTRAPMGATGTLLLDPADYYIDQSFVTRPPGASTILVNDLNTQLQTSSVVIATNNATSPVGQNGDINVNGSVNWSAATTLTLSAFRNINLPDLGANPNIRNTGAGNLVLRADSTGTGTGTVVLPFSTFNNRVDWLVSTGHVTVFYNPTSYATPTNFTTSPANGRFTLASPSQLTAYMLVNSRANLDPTSANNIGLNLSGTYALGRDIDASGPALAPLGSPSLGFSGLLDGQGHTISNLTIAPTAPAISNVGLFATIQNAGMVRNLTLSNVSVTANPNVTTPSQAVIGTLAGSNAGIIENVTVSGVVTNTTSPGARQGGIVGDNTGTISHSHAAVDVVFNGPPNLSNVGGLAGQNSGTITASDSSGNVTVSGNVFAGGLVGNNSGAITLSSTSGTVTVSSPGGQNTAIVGGLVGNNLGTISQSTSTANVVLNSPASSGISNIAGGFVGRNSGDISQSSASGTVSAANGILGGFVGMNDDAGANTGVITSSFATGNITVTGGFGFAGGFVGFNFADIATSFATGNVAFTGAATGFGGGFVGVNAGPVNQSFASGAVTAGGPGFFGGFAGFNMDGLSQVYATGPVTGGPGAVIGGLAGVNLGAIDQTYATGLLTGGPNAKVGGLVGANSIGALGAFANDPTIQQSGDTAGTVTNSYWDTQRTGTTTSDGGTGLTTAQLVSGLPAGFDPAVWTIRPGQTYPFLFDPAPNPAPVPREGAFVGLPPFQPDDRPLVTTPTQQIADLTRDSDPTPSTPAALVTPTQPRPQPRPNVAPANRQVADRPDSGVPPPGETRFIHDQVVFQVGGNVPAARIALIARRLGLTLLSSQSLGLIDRTVYQFRITNGQSVADVIRKLEALRVIAAAQPNYVFDLAQAEPASRPPAGTPVNEGDAAQYMVAKLRLPEVHRLVRGTNVKVAVIDSEIDGKHPDLEGVIAERFSAVGSDDKPHPHGTGMAGAIASHKRLIGIAPGVRLLAVQAFGTGNTGGQGTSMQIVKGLDWAVTQGARVINMSFAGPRDPLLAQAAKVIHDKGVVLIAAAGNAGPNSPPLFPGADPNVIAVTATDADDHSYTNANRGRYVAVAAPGVDILVPAPSGGYQLTTGTSVAAAHVSGVAALLLERNPKLTPDEIRSILTSTAKTLGTRTRDDEFGYGLVDPLRALNSVNPRASDAAPAAVPRTAAR